ncbi:MULTISPECIES: thioesterase II family protein [unclassified Streptomyces]|uniref:thioesterase II family protein n=1 Tax=unclassified Streptomyces TaxID=2593676 RepID=UPI003657DEA1
MNGTNSRTSYDLRRPPRVAFIPPSCCGTGYYRRLRTALGRRVDFRAVELPGHGRRFGEPALTDAEAAVADVARQLDGPVDAIYGESLGAYLGLALAATARPDATPFLIAASNSPPSARAPIDTTRITDIESAVSVLTSMGGEIPTDVVSDPELAGVFFPVIRDDLLLSQSCIALTRSLAIPSAVHVVAGADDAACTHLDGWADHTAARCTVTVVPGGHLLSAGDAWGLADSILHLLKEELDG